MYVLIQGRDSLESIKLVQREEGLIIKHTHTLIHKLMHKILLVDEMCNVNTTVAILRYRSSSQNKSR